MDGFKRATGCRESSQTLKTKMFVHGSSPRTFGGRCWLLLGRWGEVEVEENAFPLCIHLSHGWGSSCHHPYLCSSSIFIYLCLNLREEGGDVSSSLLLVGPFWFGACLRVPCNSVLLFSALKKTPRLIFSFPTDPGA